MTSNELAAAGQALYGERWQTSLSVDLQVADRTMRRWLAGETPIPAGVEKEVREVLINRAKEIAEIIGYLVNSSDRSVVHCPTNAFFRYDEAGNLTLVHPGMAAPDSVLSMTEGAKEVLHQERELEKEMAKSFVRASAWWMDHPSGPVRAPKHAEGVRMSRHGWAVEFGANSFLVGKAIEWSRSFLDQCRDAALAGKVIPRSHIGVELKKVISRAVANSNGEIYGGRYPLRNDVLKFGVHGIGVDDGATFMIDQSDLRWDGDVLATPQLATPLTAEAPEVVPFNPAFLISIDELELSVRSANCLKNNNIIYLGDVVQKAEAEMLRTPNFGRKSLNEIKEVLAQMGLHLGMEVPGWPPENINSLAKAYAAEH